MIRIYMIIGLALSVAVGAAYWRYSYVVADNKRLKTNLEIAEWSIGETKRLADLDLEQAKVALSKQEAFANENKRVADCYASGRCGKLLVKSQCPAANKTGVPSEIPEGYAALDDDVRLAVFDFRLQLGTVLNDFEDCKARLKSLSQ